MEIQELIRERVIGNIKIGKKGANGLPQKLAYFNAEKDKTTSDDMVDVFKAMYPDKPDKLKIRFTSENPFSYNFKKYVNGKATCIGNGEKAITVGKDAKGNNTQIEIECSKECENRKNGKCKLKGSLKFVLDGIEADGVWNLSTTGGISLSNIATEIVKCKKKNMSIVGVPFELSLTEQQSLAYGSYYSIDLHRTDIKPRLTEENGTKTLLQENKEDSKKLDVEIKNNEDSKENNNDSQESQNTPKDDNKIDFSKVFQLEGFMPTIVKGKKFDKIIFVNDEHEKVEYILHPKANQEIMSLEKGTVIYIKRTSNEMGLNILCEYDIKQVVNPNGSLSDYNEKKLKEAV